MCCSAIKCQNVSKIAQKSPENGRQHNDLGVQSKASQIYKYESTTTDQDELVNVKNLKKLLHYSEIKQFCEAYVKQLNDENS
uniref:Uncharacterized protein n=1 Tax=Ditylenchus dipsaci TaxID=166011 RepID=A0A915DKY3_9BILA